MWCPARRTLRYEASVVWSGWVDELPEGYVKPPEPNLSDGLSGIST
ncbi:hypothetical protein J7L06_03775 [Candidatus Bathyarchaeota archaeon]|nr:hypothetical protein [Candidatus Bathyarchaeota archaeon]